MRVGGAAGRGTQQENENSVLSSDVLKLYERVQVLHMRNLCCRDNKPGLSRSVRWDAGVEVEATRSGWGAGRVGQRGGAEEPESPDWEADWLGPSGTREPLGEAADELLL